MNAYGNETWVTVVANEVGDIIAVGPPDGEIADREEGGPTHHAYVPGPGQWVTTMMLPEEFNSEDGMQRLFEQHRLKGRGSEAEIVAR